MKKKVAQIIGSLSNGGIENFVVNTSKNIDKNLFDIDILVISLSDKYYYKLLKDNGIKVIDLLTNKYKNSKFKNIILFKSILSVLRENNYDVVHIHVNAEMAPILLACKIVKTPIVCVHSHTAYSKYWNPTMFNLKSKIMIKIQEILIDKIATYRLGCSEAACKRLYRGNKDTKVIFNGIDLEKFNPNKDYKLHEYNIDNNKINFVHIGRFHEQKNQKFLIEIWKNLIQYNSSMHLYIVGHGQFKEELVSYINKLGLQDSITMLPYDTNIPMLLSRMDYFLLPSLYEGLGIVLIEAQAMGITCFASDNVPKESNIGMCIYISLEKSAKEWANEIIGTLNHERKLEIDVDLLNNYDIKNVAKSLEKIYGE